MNKSVYATCWREAIGRPKGLKKSAREGLRNTILSILGNFTSPQDDNFLRCLYCHYVFDDQIDAFKKVMQVLKDKVVFVDTDTCVEMLRGEKPIDGRYFHLSFDDGFRNVFDNALPFLKELGVPAIVFVPTAFIGADWQTARNFCLETNGYEGVIEIATWEEILRAREDGFEIGSHTRQHARFSDISGTDQLVDEIAGSKADLEAKLQEECRYISWPYGTRSDADEISLVMTRETGYSACFGAFRGTIIPHQTDVYSIPRHHIEMQWPLSHIRYFSSGNMEN